MIDPPELEIDKKLNRLGQLNATERMYRRVVANLLNHLQNAGFSLIRVYDGEDNTKATTIKDVMEIVFNLDEAWIFVLKPGYKSHYIFIVLGNEDPEDLICDWSFTNDDPDSFDAAMESFRPENFA